MEEQKKVCINTSPLFQSKRFILLEMCIEEEAEEQQGQEIYTGPVTLDDCKAFTFRHAYEKFRKLVRELYESYARIYFSDLEKAYDYFDDYGSSPKEIQGFVVSFHDTDSDISRSIQFFIVEDSEFIQRHLAMCKVIEGIDTKKDSPETIVD